MDLMIFAAIYQKHYPSFFFCDLLEWHFPVFIVSFVLYMTEIDVLLKL